MSEEEAEVGIASLRLGKEGEMRAAFERNLGAGDGAHAEGLGRLGERHRPVEAVMVGEGKGVVAELAGAQHQLLRRRSALAEGVAGVAVQFNIVDTIRHWRYTYLDHGIIEEQNMAATKVSRKGWVVIPRDIRERHGIRPGDRVQIVDFGGTIAIIPIPEDPIASGRGLLKGGPSMTEGLLADRRWELEREERDLPPPPQRPKA